MTDRENRPTDFSRLQALVASTKAESDKFYDSWRSSTRRLQPLGNAGYDEVEEEVKDACSDSSSSAVHFI